MLLFQHFILCASLLLVCEHAVAQGPPKSGKRYDEALHSYVFEPSDDFSDFQADATTAYPPLVEYETNTQAVDGSVPVIAPPPPPPPPKSEEVEPPKLPEGPVAQYVNTYGGPYYPQSNSYPNNYYPGYPWQYLTQPPYYSQPQPNVPSYVQMPEYEGILVPVQTFAPPQRAHQNQIPAQTSQMQPTQPISSTSSKSSETKASPVNKNSSDLALILQALLPQSVIQFIIAIGNFLLNSFGTLAFAGAITSVLCTITPLCTISFGTLPFGFRQVLIEGGEVSTIQRVRRAAEVVSNALEKYEKLQKGVESLTNTFKRAQRKTSK